MRVKFFIKLNRHLCRVHSIQTKHQLTSMTLININNELNENLIKFIEHMFEMYLTQIVY